MLTAALTLVVLLAGLAAGHASRLDGAATRWVCAGTTSCALIVVVETVLAAAGWLTKPALVAAAAAVALVMLALVAVAFRLRFADLWRAELDALREALRVLRHPEIATLAAIGVVAWTWVAAAASLLPPRSVDDLGHHLPPIFEAVVRGRFALPPLDLQPWFAYPLNADLLSLWPTLLQQGIELTTFPQLATAGLGALVVVAFARGAGVTRRSAAFAGLLYALLPVTLRQASSCYTDLTVAAFFGAAALGAARFFTTGAAGALLLAGLGAGLLAGTKYNMLFAALLLLPLIFARLRSQAHRAAGIGRAALLFAAPVAGLSGYWLLRNWIVLGNPCFPYPVGIGPLTLFAGALPPRSPLVDSPPLLLSALRAPATLWRISLTDCGLGSVDGGLGPVLWGAVLPFGVVFTLVVLARWRRHRDAAGIVLAAPFIAGLAPYVLAHTVTAGVTTRFLLSAAIPGLAILVLGLARLRERSPIAGRAAMIGIAAVAALGVVQLGGNQASNERKQSMDLGPAASRARAASASPWSLVQEGAFGPNRLAPAWDFLDLVTAPAGAPTRTLWIYATSRYPAGFYGSRLQNRIWNFGAPDRPAQPEALVYYFSRLSGAVTIEESGDKIPWEQVAGRRETYEVVFFTPETAVFFRRELLAPGGDLWRRLLRYYEQVAPPLAEAAERLAQTTGPADTVVAVDPIGFSLKALEMDGRLKAQVLLAHRRELDALRLRPREGGLLWLVAPLAPGASSPVQELRVGDRVVGIFKMDAAAP